ncbi:M14 family metallopeptidase [Alteromonas oceanisediminis]|uniref:M14 family metallopeptidase n=1 Tax=Alteromonas oceanisediminis TaxID=2836180 RepID=UPI001BDA4AE4|nr:M14 family metallopeptidase [Alteromonas oceanisediminis]MBT0586276.1 peptidase [Alteromonas oceanisediminis]
MNHPFPLLAALLVGVMSFTSNASLLIKPSQDPDLAYQGTILSGKYDTAVTSPQDLLGFPVGQRVATPAQIMQAVDTWATQSDRLKVVEYARSHEDRPLYAVFIGSPTLLEAMPDIKQKLATLADPRGVSDQQASALIDELPAVAWMAYSIHGNETSGADAALASIYHLIASQDSDVKAMLDDMLVVIDPIMNPDGRARFAKSLEQYRGTAPNVDDQSLLHNGDWPYGRTNHYFFDLNRDFFYLTQPETQGRVGLINQWRPQLMIDGHEMGAQDTYLMGPPRQPLNDNISPSLQKWAEVFARDQGQAFDQRGWRYYTGEWFENWYPGYSNYAEYRGSMHILYEQSRMAEDGVRRPEGTVQTYMESVHHQYVSTMANLKTLAQHSDAMYQDYWQARKESVSKKGRYADKTFVIAATENHSRLDALAQKLLAQDIEVYRADRAITLKKATNHLGQTQQVDVAKGSLVIPNRQPEARLLSAIMEFDAGVLPEVLKEERESVLRDGSSIMYDTTAWNLTMMYGLAAFEVPRYIDEDVSPYQMPTPRHTLVDGAIAWTVNGADDNAPGFAAQLMEQGIQVRVLDKSTTYAENDVARSAVVVTVTDNPNRDDLVAQLKSTADKFNLGLTAHTSGFGEGDLPDWGGRHFKLLTRPQLALLSQGNVSFYDLGATWWSVDHYLGIRHSQLDINRLRGADLRRYNVIVLPETWSSLDEPVVDALSEWVKQGGTLIANGRSAGRLAEEKNGIGSVRQIEDSFADAGDYNLALHRDWLALNTRIDVDTVQAHAMPSNVTYPWDNAPKSLDKDTLEKQDAWQKLFMPRGTMVAGRFDQRHWLTFGVPESMPVLFGRQPVLMAKSGVDAVGRVGEYIAGDTETPEKANAWYTHPENQQLYVRMSGLLWPEAAHRIANSAYVTRQGIGKGQLILFSGQPNFRGAAKGSNRLLLNAIVYGPGLGAKPTVNL